MFININLFNIFYILILDDYYKIHSKFIIHYQIFMENFHHLNYLINYLINLFNYPNNSYSILSFPHLLQILYHYYLRKKIHHPKIPSMNLINYIFSNLNHNLQLILNDPLNYYILFHKKLLNVIFNFNK